MDYGQFLPGNHIGVPENGWDMVNAVGDIMWMLLQGMYYTFYVLGNCLIFPSVTIMSFIVVLFVIHLLIDNFYFSSKGRSPAQLKVNNGRWSKDE